MPIYSFRDKTSGEVTDHMMRIADKEQFRIDHPYLEEVFTKAPALGDAMRLGLIKPDGSWRDTLQKVVDNGKELGINPNTIGLR